MISIHAYESTGRPPYPSTHTRIDVEVKIGPDVIFARGDTWCGVAAHVPLDGIEARALVMSLVAMRPGDTDSDYFASYTPAQLEFAETYGEALGCVRESRYCDENGNVKKGLRP